MPILSRACAESAGVLRTSPGCCTDRWNRRSESVSLDALGYLYQEWGEVRKALEYHERALAIAREIGDRQAIGHCLGHLGTAYYALGQPQQAIAYYAQALAIARDVGDHQWEGCLLGYLGDAHAALEEREQALGYHAQALAILYPRVSARSPTLDHWRVF